MLAYDQGLEHGPVDFNLDNIDPQYIVDIANEGGFNAVIFQHGIAEKYAEKIKVPLIIKLNGKTNLADVAPYSAINCSVKRAVKLGASAVGYTIYLGSPRESDIFREFAEVVEEAHRYGLPVIAWVYPRGPKINDDKTTELLAYAARTGLELGADVVKIKYNDDIEGFKWVTKAAGKTKVVVAGGAKLEDKKLLENVKDIMQTGACGMAIGRNVWQHDNPLGVSRALKKIVFDDADVESALKEIN